MIFFLRFRRRAWIFVADIPARTASAARWRPATQWDLHWNSTPEPPIGLVPGLFSEILARVTHETRHHLRKNQHKEAKTFWLVQTATPRHGVHRRRFDVSNTRPKAAASEIWEPSFTTKNSEFRTTNKGMSQENLRIKVWRNVKGLEKGVLLGAHLFSTFFLKKLI